VSTEVQVGLQTGFENAAVEEPGRPSTERVTGWEVPERRERATEEVTLFPGSTLFEVPAFIEKFQGAGGVDEVTLMR